MLQSLTLDSFAARLGESFRICLEDAHSVSVELISAQTGGPRQDGGQGARTPFSLVFRGPLQPVLPQRIYRFEHEGMGAFDIFIVPIGPGDAGTQYRSVIFCHSPEQQAAAGQVVRELEAQKLWGSPIVTQIVPFEQFYLAEDYHQEYFRQNGRQPYCQMVVAPKVAKFRKLYRDRLKA